MANKGQKDPLKCKKEQRIQVEKSIDLLIKSMWLVNQSFHRFTDQIDLCFKSVILTDFITKSPVYQISPRDRFTLQIDTLIKLVK